MTEPLMHCRSCRSPHSAVRERRAFNSDCGLYCDPCWAKESVYIDGLRLNDAEAFDLSQGHTPPAWRRAVELEATEGDLEGDDDGEL